MFLSLGIVILDEVDLSDFSSSIGLLIFEAALDAVKHVDALLKVFQCFWEFPLEFVSNADVVHDPCVVGVSLPVFEQQVC